VGVSVTAVFGAVSTPGVVIEAICSLLEFPVLETRPLYNACLLIPLILSVRCRESQLGRKDAELAGSKKKPGFAPGKRAY